MKNKKGDTLIEVLVSIIVLAIIFYSISQIIISIKKTQNRIQKIDNIINEIVQVEEIFTINPKTFDENLAMIYPIIKTNNFIYIYYDNQFNISTEVTNNFLKIMLKQISINEDSRKYLQLKIEVYIDNFMYQIEPRSLEKTICIE